MKKFKKESNSLIECALSQLKKSKEYQTVNIVNKEMKDWSQGYNREEGRKEGEMKGNKDHVDIGKN